MRRWRIAAFTAVAAFVQGCTHSQFFNDDQAVSVFAPAPALLEPTRFDQYSAFAPDGNEYYLSVADADWNYRGILRSVRRNGNWSSFEPLPIVWGPDKDGGEPFISRDGRHLYFVSARAGSRPDETAMAGSAGIVQSGETDVYMAERLGSGWSEPKRLPPPLNSRSSEWHPTVADDGTIFFASERGRQDGKADIYFARPTATGEYTQVERLGAPVNLDSSNDSDPFIAPDRSYLVFHSDRPGGFGEHDLYVSYRSSNGSWSEPRNLGPEINSSGWEMGPSVTRDGRLLLFTRRVAIKTNEPSRVYAISAKVIHRLER